MALGMARNVAHVAAPPERVFAVLHDAATYADWVVGTQAVRATDRDWPAPGSRLHHSVGIGPLHVDDHTEILESAPPHRLVLLARTRPLGTARVELDLAPEAGGTRVTMIEDPGDGWSRLLWNPLAHVLVRVRNAESLRRLRRLAERPAR
jgi:uncharacterized protein YndB with AHSA1/START domain